MSTQSIEITDRLLVYGVHTTISETQLRNELLPTYHGIKHIERLYNTYDDGYKTPKEVIQLEFTSPKYTETFLQEGFIKISNLRCKVKALKPSKYLEKQLFEGNYTFNEEQGEVTKKILVHDVPITISENNCAMELSRIYSGVRQVKRWYSKNDYSNEPTTRVQVDFQSPKATETILQNGFIQISQNCYSVTPLKSNQFQQQKQYDSDYGSDYQSYTYKTSEHTTNKILLYNVPTTIDANILQRELSKTYAGITQVIRWCFDDNCQYPTVCVQINFIAPRYAKAILQHGFVVYDNVCYEAKSLKSKVYATDEFESDSQSDYQSEIFNE